MKHKKKPKHENRNRRILWDRVLCTSLLLFSFAFFVTSLTRYIVVKTKAESKTHTYVVREFGNPETKFYAKRISFVKAGPDDIWKANEEKLRNLSGTVYYTLSEEERLDYLALLGYIEIYRLTGQDNPDIRFCALEMSANEPIGYYARDRKEIAISRSELWALDDAIETILHEVKHYHQHQVVLTLSEQLLTDPIIQNLDLYDFKVSEWAQNFLEYKDAYDENGNRNELAFDAYYEQEIETNSRAFAAQRRKEFRHFISTGKEFCEEDIIRDDLTKR